MQFQQKKMQMSQNLQNFVKFQKFQLENLVDFEKCCKTHIFIYFEFIFLQTSEPIQPKTSNILPKFCQPTLSDAAGRPAAPQVAPTARSSHRLGIQSEVCACIEAEND